MKLISLHESDWKLSRVDSLVREGVFSSRAEVYRAGALVLVLMSEAQRYAKLDKLDSDLFGKEIKVCLDGLRSRAYGIAKEKLREIADTLKLRAIICPLLNDQNMNNFMTLSETMKKYADLLSKFDSFDKEEQSEIVEEIQRDLSILLEFLKLTEEELMQYNRGTPTKDMTFSVPAYSQPLQPYSSLDYAPYAVTGEGKYFSVSDLEPVEQQNLPGQFFLRSISRQIEAESAVVESGITLGAK